VVSGRRVKLRSAALTLQGSSDVKGNIGRSELAESTTIPLSKQIVPYRTLALYSVCGLFLPIFSSFELNLGAVSRHILRPCLVKQGSRSAKLIRSITILPLVQRRGSCSRIIPGFLTSLLPKLLSRRTVASSF